MFPALCDIYGAPRGSELYRQLETSARLLYMVKILPVTKGQKICLVLKKRVTLLNGIFCMLLCEEKTQTQRQVILMSVGFSF